MTKKAQNYNVNLQPVRCVLVMGKQPSQLEDDPKCLESSCGLEHYGLSFDLFPQQHFFFSCSTLILWFDIDFSSYYFYPHRTFLYHPNQVSCYEYLVYNYPFVGIVLGKCLAFCLLCFLSLNFFRLNSYGKVVLLLFCYFRTSIMFLTRVMIGFKVIDLFILSCSVSRTMSCHGILSILLSIWMERNSWIFTHRALPLGV